MKDLKRSGVEAFFIIIKSLFSSDSATRRMALFFFISVFGMILVFRMAFLEIRNGFRPTRLQEQHKARLEAAALQLHEEEVNQKAAQVKLGRFSIELKTDASEKVPSRRLKVATVELVAQCDNQATRDSIEAHLLQARGTISGVLTPMDRADLMSRDGKMRLRKFLLDRLNLWISHEISQGMPQGKVEALYITELLIH